VGVFIEKNMKVDHMLHTAMVAMFVLFVFYTLIVFFGDKNGEKIAFEIIKTIYANRYSITEILEDDECFSE
jgi:hypothetical protein